MTAAAFSVRRVLDGRWHALALPVMTGAAFLILFWQPLTSLVRDWVTDPDAAHGLLLAPLALVLAWPRGLVEPARPQPLTGIALLIGAVLLRYCSGLAAELFTMRISLLLALVAIVVWARGTHQVARWWLPFSLLALAIPLPAVILGSIALPLQLKASQLGAWLLTARHVPVVLSGNIIRLPGRALFVTEACSGLRSLTALLSLGVLIGGLWLGAAWARGLLVLAAIPVAMVVNAVRIFLTGFLVYFVNPDLADGFLHYTQGWVLFLVAFALLAGFAWGLGRIAALRGAA